MLKLCTTVLSILLGFNSLALSQYASRMPTNYQSLDKIIQEHRSKCSGVAGEGSVCGDSWSHQDLFSKKNGSNKISPNIIETFQRLAFDQAQIWGDTILEGDYVSSGDTSLESIFAIRNQSSIVAYYITYSEKAWFVGDCEYDEDHLDTLNECTMGVISEGAYVSADLKTIMTDSDHFADFQ